MEVSEVRNRLVQTIEHAKKQAAARRVRSDGASRAFETWLTNVAVPMFRQIANVLRSENYLFTVFTPAGSVRLMSDRAAEDYIEVLLDTSGDAPHVIGHTSRSRGRRVMESEQIIGEPGALNDEGLLEFLLKELEVFVDR